MVAQFVDVSSFQEQIDFAAYRQWAASFDGIARIAMKATEGIGFVDPLFAENRAKALAAGIDVLFMYHFGRPDLGNNPVDEAKFMHSVVGDIRANDGVFLDYEVSSALATSEWAYAWLAQQEDSYNGKLPGIYASEAYILERLQDVRLKKYALWEAKWEFTPDERPVCPPPWSSYEFVQYTDRATIPGIQGVVDADIFLGGTTPMPQSPQVPAGWSDDGTTLTAPNSVPVIGGFRDHVLNSAWDKDNFPLKPEYQANPVEQSNPSLGSGAAQDFRWKRLAWCQKLGIYESWLGQELVWYQKQTAQLQAQITQLENLPIVANFQQISMIGKQISDDVALILKLAQTQ